MGKLLLGVVISKEIADEIKNKKFNNFRYTRSVQFKVLNLDSMQVEDAGINDINNIVNFKFDVSDNTAVVGIECTDGLIEYAEDEDSRYLVFVGDKLVSYSVYEVDYIFQYHIQLVFNFNEGTYKILPNSIDVSSNTLIYDFIDLEFGSICSLGYTLQDGVTVVGDVIVIGRIGQCLIIPSGVKTVYFEYGLEDDIDCSIVIPPSVDEIVFRNKFWCSRVLTKLHNTIKINIPKSKFCSLYSSIAKTIKNEYFKYSSINFGYSLEHQVWLQNLSESDAIEFALKAMNIEISSY